MYNQQIKFYNVEKLLPEYIERVRTKAEAIYLKKWSITGPFRLMVGNLLPSEIDKLIYLDADLIINLDIRELWQIELGDSPFAAVFEGAVCGYDPAGRKICQDGFVKPENYLNVGVMVMNLNRFRSEEKTIWAGVDSVIKRGYNPFDQETLNYCFSNETLKLPTKFNVGIRTMKHFSAEVPIEKKIYHYLGKGDSLGLDMRDKFNRLYWKYFCKTPFFSEDTIGNIFVGVRESTVELKNLMAVTSAAISGKRRAFVTFPQNIDAMKKIFYAQEGEEIFRIDSSNWFEKLASKMRDGSGREIFFLLVGGIYPQLYAALTQMGFVEWRDFLNAEIFLSELHGVQLNSYPLIEKM